MIALMPTNILRIRHRTARMILLHVTLLQTQTAAVRASTAGRTACPSGATVGCCSMHSILAAVAERRLGWLGRCCCSCNSIARVRTCMLLSVPAHCFGIAAHA
jgi:hypothetical protein